MGNDDQESTNCGRYPTTFTLAFASRDGDGVKVSDSSTLAYEYAKRRMPVTTVVHREFLSFQLLAISLLRSSTPSGWRYDVALLVVDH